MILRSKLIQGAFTAVDAGDQEALISLLRDDPSLLRVTDHRYDSLLHRAAAAGALKMMSFLVEAGIDINVSRIRIDGISTPLHDAARRNQIAAVNWLVENGANIDAGIHRNGTPLVAAAIGGHFEAVGRLIELGADINASYKIETVDGGTVTLNAVRAARLKGLSKMVDFLVDLGASEI